MPLRHHFHGLGGQAGVCMPGREERSGVSRETPGIPSAARLGGAPGPILGQKVGSMHCSSGLSLLPARLASATNPLNNCQLLSKSTRALNHESLS